MKRHTIIITGVALAVAAAAAGIAGAAQAGTDGGDHDTPITGDALVSAEEAALAHLGEGTVTETEVGDEESYYEVEVTLDSGRQVDVQLDREFNVVGADAEEQPDDD